MEIGQACPKERTNLQDTLLEELETLEHLWRNVTQVRRVEAFRGLDDMPVDADGWEALRPMEKSVFTLCANHLRELIRKYKKKEN